MNSLIRAISTNFAALILGAVLGLAPQLLRADTIKIGGTGAGRGSLQKLAEAFNQIHPEHNIKVFPGLGSRGSIKAMQARALDIAVISRELKPEEAQSGLTSTKYATSPFVFVSNQTVPSQNLTLRDIADIYSGRRTHWANRESIRLILRPLSDSDSTLLQNMSTEIDLAVKNAGSRSGMRVAMTDNEAVDTIERTADSFGTTTLSLVLSEARKVNVMSVNGVAPTVRSVSDGSYPFSKSFYLITTTSSSDAIRQFVRFVQSREGRHILLKTGNNPHNEQ